MKTRFCISLLATMLLFTLTCKKSSNSTTDTPVTKTKKYLTHIISSSVVPGADGSSTVTGNIYYTYDSQKRLSAIKNGDNLTTYAYYDDGNLFSISNSFSGSTTRGVTEFTYADGRLKQYTVKTYKNNVLDSETPYVYVYEGNKVTEIHWEVYYAKFTYDGKGNIVKMFHYGDPQYTSVYTYDDKKSMYINSLLKYPMVADMGGAVSLNNRVTSTTEGLNQNVLTSYTYNYDDEGYPTGATTAFNIANAVVSKYTYEYTTLD